MAPDRSPLPDLLPALRGLWRADKLRVIQYLAGDLAREEDISPLERGATYYVWTPYGETNAAETLARVLAEEGKRP